MANPRDVGHFYWHPLVYPIKPPVLWERAETQEISEPFRFGVGLSIRLPFTRLALVIGKWGESLNESQALTNAIRGRAMDKEEVDWDYVRFGQEAEAGATEN
jgi:hypothetical protein